MNLPHTHTHTDVIKHTAGVRLQVTAERGRNDEKKKKNKKARCFKICFPVCSKDDAGPQQKEECGRAVRENESLIIFKMLIVT